MKTITAFLLGMAEFRHAITTNCGAQDHAYESGREWAHRLTLRHFED